MFPGYSETTPGNAIPFGGPQNVYQIYDDLSWTKGRHQFKFGGGYVQTRDNRAFGAYENAVESLASSGSISAAAASLAAGQLYQFQGAVYPQGQFPCSRNAAQPYVVTPGCLLNSAGWAALVQPQQPLQRRQLLRAGFVEDDSQA